MGCGSAFSSIPESGLRFKFLRTFFVFSFWSPSSFEIVWLLGILLPLAAFAALNNTGPENALKASVFEISDSCSLVSSSIF